MAKSSHKARPESRIEKLALAVHERSCKVTSQRGMDTGRREGLSPCSQMPFLNSSRNKVGAPDENKNVEQNSPSKQGLCGPSLTCTCEVQTLSLSSGELEPMNAGARQPTVKYSGIL